MVDAYRENEKAKELRKELEFIYDKNEEIASTKMRRSSLSILATRRQGVAIATPVFDGAKEEDINELLEHAGLNLRPGHAL
jgi:DNA-directed RNA polymerase subunit beta